MFYTNKLWGPGFREETSVCVISGAEEDIGGMHGSQGWWAPSTQCQPVLCLILQVCYQVTGQAGFLVMFGEA